MGKKTDPGEIRAYAAFVCAVKLFWASLRKNVGHNSNRVLPMCTETLRHVARYSPRPA
jgi:hypothetical protein